MAFPQILGTAKGAINSNSATLSFSLPTGINAGEMLVVMVACDGVPALAASFANMSPGWNVWWNRNNTSGTPTAILFWKRATGSDSAPSITVATSEQCTWVSMRLSVDTLISFETPAEWFTGSSTNSTFNTAGPDLIPALDYTFVAFRAGDAQVQPTAASTNYTLVDSQTAGTTNGASVYVQKRELNTQSTTPGALTVATEQWATMAVAFYFDPDGYTREIDALMREIITTPVTTDAFSFRSNGLNLKRIYVQAFKGSTAGTCYAELYAHSGTFGVSGVPTGSALATTATETITGTNQYGAVELTFATPYQTTNGTDYFIRLVTTGGVSFAYFPSEQDVTAIGNTATFSGGTWTATAYSSKGVPPYYLYSTPSTAISGDITESIAASDSTDETLQTTGAISESIAATDSTDETLETTGAITESIAATESQTASTGAITADASETITASDTADRVHILGGSVSESISATEAQDRTASITRSVSESIAATDSTDETLSTSGAITESTAASDSPNRSLTTTGAITESIAASEAQTVGLNYSVAVSESISATETVNAIFVLGVTVSESVSVTETQGRIYTATATTSESISATDSTNRTASLVGSMAESITITESQGVSVSYVLTITESVIGTDTQVGFRSSTSSITEAIGANDLTNSSVSGLVTSSGYTKTRIICGTTSTSINTTKIKTTPKAGTINTKKI